MDNFKKWFEETYPLPPTMERGPISRDLKAGCKAAYRTALEWMLEDLDKHDLLSWTVKRHINKELKDEN